MEWSETNNFKNNRLAKTSMIADFCNKSALSDQSGMSSVRTLSGGKQTSSGKTRIDANDP